MANFGKKFILILSITLFLLFSFCSKEQSTTAGNKKIPGDNKKNSQKMTKEDFQKMSPEERKAFMEKMRKMRQSSGDKGGLSPLVKVKKVDKQTIKDSLVLNTTLEPEKSILVYSKVEGIINGIVKEEGEKVNKNDILATIDDRDIRNSYEEAKLSVENAKLAVKDAEIRMENAKEKFNRQKSLYEEEIISEQDFKTAKLDRDSAALDYEQALHTLNIEKEQYKNLKLQLSYTEIRSPIDGWVTDRKIDEGTRVNSGTELYQVEDFEPLLAKVYVPEKDYIKLKEGQEVDVTSEVYKKTFKGKVKIINPRIDSESGTFKVTVAVNNYKLKLRPGMLVTCEIIVNKKENSIVIPKKAVFYKKSTPYVYILQEGNIVKLKEIELGIEMENEYEIISGVSESDIVVTQGIENISEGTQVKVI